MRKPPTKALCAEAVPVDASSGQSWSGGEGVEGGITKDYVTVKYEYWNNSDFSKDEFTEGVFYKL